jgi:hypothetical protein
LFVPSRESRLFELALTVFSAMLTVPLPLTQLRPPVPGAHVKAQRPLARRFADLVEIELALVAGGFQVGGLDLARRHASQLEDDCRPVVPHG